MLITGRGSSDSFGTGFVVGIDDAAAWVVTCRHVVDQYGSGDQVLANSLPAEPVGEAHPEIDLAVLRVPGLACTRALPLATTVLPGRDIWVPGWKKVVKDIKRRDPLRATLGQRCDFSVTGATIQRTFEFQVDGFANPDSFDTAPREAAVHPGYSGAPIICATTGEVLAVASIKQGEGGIAFAVSIEHLVDLWPVEAATACWSASADAVGGADAIALLADVLRTPPAGIGVGALKRHLARCAPPGLPLDLPAGEDPMALALWLAEPRQWANGHAPLHDALTRLLAEPLDPAIRAPLEALRRRVAEQYRDLATEAPIAPAADTRPIGMEIELIPPSGGQKSKRLDVLVRLLGSEGTPSQVVLTAEDRDVERLRPDDDEEIGLLLDTLLSEHVAPDIDPARFRFVFRLPRALIGLPVDRWRCTNGDPIGIDFPVLAQDRDRAAGDGIPIHWNRAWTRLRDRLPECFPAPLRWCCEPEETRFRAAARQARDTGEAIALGFVDDPAADGDDSKLVYLLKHLGAPVLLWPRHRVPADELRAELDRALHGQPLGELPQCLLRHRRACADDPARAKTPPQVSLVWDPYRPRRKPSLFGVD